MAKDDPEATAYCRMGLRLGTHRCPKYGDFNPRQATLRLVAVVEGRRCSGDCVFLRSKYEERMTLRGYPDSVTSWKCKLFGKLNAVEGPDTLKCPERHVGCIEARRDTEA
jgi:hypothetical protein